MSSKYMNGNIEKNLQMSGKIAPFNGISRTTADFTESRPFCGPHHCLEITK